MSLLRTLLCGGLLLACTGCSWIDYYTPADNPEANQIRTTAAVRISKPITGTRHYYDSDALRALQGERIESPGLRLLAKTPQGASVDRSNLHDLLSTAVGLSVQEGAREVNGLGWALIPIKAAMGRYLIDPMPCVQRANVSGILNTAFHGLAMNNWAVALGATPQVSIPVGIVGGTIYYAFRTSIEPGVYTCGKEGQ